MSHKHLYVALSLISLFLAACSQANTASLPPAEVEKMYVEESASSVEMQPSRDLATNTWFTNQPADAEQLVIKNGNLIIVVDDPALSMDHISALADEMGGFVVNANLYQTELESGMKVHQATVTIRVPSERLNEALQRIRAETDLPVVSENISSQDVTDDYTDLQSQLTNLEAAEQQLQEIMDGAVKTEDVLAVYNQLTQVRGQIEVIKGQMKYYEESAALSAISVELLPNEAVEPLTIGGWQPGGVAKDAIQTLIDALKIIMTVAIYVILLVVPVLVIILVPPILIIWALLRWRARRRTKAATPPQA
jgi:hypothetical protein